MRARRSAARSGPRPGPKAAPPRVPPRAAALLSVQRMAGNRATSRLVDHLRGHVQRYDLRKGTTAAAAASGIASEASGGTDRNTTAVGTKGTDKYYVASQIAFDEEWKRKVGTPDGAELSWDGQRYRGTGVHAETQIILSGWSPEKVGADRALCVWCVQALKARGISRNGATSGDATVQWRSPEKVAGRELAATAIYPYAWYTNQMAGGFYWQTYQQQLDNEITTEATKTPANWTRWG